MTRKYIDCRTMPSDIRCSIAIVADTENEVLEAAVLHAVSVHKHQDTPELRDAIRHAIRDGMPSEQAPSLAS